MPRSRGISNFPINTIQTFRKKHNHQRVLASCRSRTAALLVHPSSVTSQPKRKRHHKPMLVFGSATKLLLRITSIFHHCIQRRLLERYKKCLQHSKFGRRILFHNGCRAHGKGLSYAGASLLDLEIHLFGSTIYSLPPCLLISDSAPRILPHHITKKTLWHLPV